MNNQAYDDYIDSCLQLLNSIQNKWRYILYSDNQYKYNLYASGYGTKLDYVHTNDVYETLYKLHAIIKAETGEKGLKNSRRRKKHE